jgi:hypothetical protein
MAARTPAIAWAEKFFGVDLSGWLTRRPEHADVRTVSSQREREFLANATRKP